MKALTHTLFLFLGESSCPALQIELKGIPALQTMTSHMDMTAQYCFLAAVADVPCGVVLPLVRVQL